MTSSFSHGPGTLVLDPGGDDQALQAQLSSFEVEPSESVTAGSTIDLLDGGSLNDGDTSSVSWKCNGTAVQDIIAAGLVAYSWDHEGEEIPFKWIPNTVAARQVTGVIVMVPLKLGGPVKKRNTSDFSWRLTEAPILANVP